MRSRPVLVEPDVFIRIVHSAQVGQHRAPEATYREQTVEVAVESKGVFTNDPVADVTRRTHAPGDPAQTAISRRILS